MAKNKKTETTEPQADIMFDGIPGADVLSETEASKSFEADLNFDTPDDEVEFPKEDEIEEIEESELSANTEEEEEGDVEEGETETIEASDEAGESEGEETVLEQDERGTQHTEGTVPEGVVETKEPMIPKSRFDEVLAKQKALQKKLEEATSPVIDDITEVPEYDFDAKEIEYQNLVLDGEAESAVKLRNEIRNAEKQQMMFEMQAKMGQTVSKSQEISDLEAKAIEIQAAYPNLDENNASYDENKTNEVMELRDAYMIQGYAGADALQKATNLIMGTPTPKTNAISQKVVEKKKVANTTKKLEAADSQPPAMKGKNKTEKKIDLNVLSTDEFDALPEETLRRMRGDFG